jgi:hypothetical protein
MTLGLYKNLKTLSFVAFLLFLSTLCHAETNDFVTGLRGGLSFDGGTHRLQQMEVFGEWEWPCRWDFYSNWYFRPRLDLTAGWITNQRVDGFVGTLGPALELHKGKFPVFLEGGIAPTILSEYHYNSKNFGDYVQFTSHIGFQWQITKHFSVGWRFQHMSNGGLASPNPGVNFEMFSASYRF